MKFDELFIGPYLVFATEYSLDNKVNEYSYAYKTNSYFKYYSKILLNHRKPIIEDLKIWTNIYSDYCIERNITKPLIDIYGLEDYKYTGIYGAPIPEYFGAIHYSSTDRTHFILNKRKHSSNSMNSLVMKIPERILFFDNVNNTLISLKDLVDKGELE